MSTPEPEISHFFCGGVYAKRLRFKRGTYGDQHAHLHDHLSVVASGFCRVEVDGESKDYGPGECVEIAAGKVHRVRALTDATWLCIWRDDVGTGDPAETDAALIDPSLPQPGHSP